MAAFGRRVAVALVALFACIVVGPPPATAATRTFTPVADAPTASAWSTTNYARHKRLVVNRRGTASSATRQSYVKFDVRLPAGVRVSGAQLRLYSTSTSSAASVVHKASNAWTERTLTWKSRPAVSSARLGSDRPTARGWRTVKLPAAAVVRGRNSFRLSGGASSALSDYHSREAVNAPRLVVSYAPTPGPAPPRPGPAGGQGLVVQGKRIIDAATGRDVWLRGVNVMRSEWNGDMSRERQSLPLLGSSWSGNIVVRGFAADPVNARDPRYLAMLDEYVSLARANGLYVAFVFRSYGIDGEQPDSPDQRATDALTYLAARYKGSPRVILGLQVEPHNVTWSQVRPKWDSMISSIRGPSGSASSTQPLILAPGVRWGHDVSGAIADPVQRPNVVYKTHPYGSQSYWYDDWERANDAGRPVFIGEFSLAPDLGSTMTEVNALLAKARARHIGWAAWTWDTCACGAGQEALLSDWATASPTTPYGKTVQAAMRTP